MAENTETNGAATGAQQSVEQQQPPVAPAALVPVRFEPETATEAWQLSKYYERSKLLPKQLVSTADVFVTIMAGRDFGWSPMQSLRGIYVVEGKPSLASDAMVAIAKTSGKCKYFRLIQSDAKSATYETHRDGDPEPVRMSFTIAEAEIAGLLAKKGPWHSYPARMLRNRAKSILCKEVYEDIFFGTYEADEAAEIDVTPVRQGGSVNPVPAAPESVASAIQKTPDPDNGQPGSAVEIDPEEVCEGFRQRLLAAKDVKALRGLADEIKDAHEKKKLISDAHRKILVGIFGERSKDFVS